MSLGFFTLRNYRLNNPTWKLLCATSSPLIISFLNFAFIKPNERIIDGSILSEKLEDVLYQLREQLKGEKQHGFEKYKNYIQALDEIIVQNSEDFIAQKHSLQQRKITLSAEQTEQQN